jgi:hypothetical protein
MIEADWDSCTDPEPILEFLRNSGKVSERKLRLFSCACVRRALARVGLRGFEHAIDLAEAAADGRASWREAQAAVPRPAGDISAPDFAPRSALEALYDALAALTRGTEGGFFEWARSAVADALYAAAHQAAVLECTRGAAEGGGAAQGAGARPARSLEALELAHQAAEGREQAALLADIFGNPFRAAPTLERALLDKHDGLVVRLAQAAYDERRLPAGTLDPARLAVLADALEEAGAPAALLEHLRSKGPHVRGCVAVDAVLGRG